MSCKDDMNSNKEYLRVLLFLWLMEKREGSLCSLQLRVLKKIAATRLLFCFGIMAYKVPRLIEWRLNLTYT